MFTAMRTVFFVRFQEESRINGWREWLLGSIDREDIIFHHQKVQQCAAKDVIEQI